MLVAASQKRSTMPSFRAPSVQANSSGWGPAEAPSQYDELPFSTFSRSERKSRKGKLIILSFPFLLFLALKELAELLIGPMPLDRIPLLEVRFFR